MPSFDTVSEVDMHELNNAVDQTNREIANRYDFKGSDAKAELKESTITLSAESDFQIKQMQPILYQKMTKRGIDVACVTEGEVEESGQRARQLITVRQGIDKDLARKLIKQLKDSKIKVQASIQGEQVRVSGKKRDDLQAAIALLKEGDFGQPLQFKNFRD
jgi:uncharacterized protein YajQ (UPF0234 family)